MSSGGYPSSSSSSQRKHYNETEKKLTHFMRQYRSQSMNQGQLFLVQYILCKIFKNCSY
jgi:hypothetical protein